MEELTIKEWALVVTGSLLGFMHFLTFCELASNGSKSAEAQVKAQSMMNRSRLLERFKEKGVRSSFSKLMQIFKEELQEEIAENWTEIYNFSVISGLFSLLLNMAGFWYSQMKYLLFLSLFSGLLMIISRQKFGFNPEEGNP